VSYKVAEFNVANNNNNNHSSGKRIATQHSTPQGGKKGIKAQLFLCVGSTG